MTRGTPRCCEAAIELPKLREKYTELQLAYERLERDNKSLRTNLEKARNRNTCLASAQSELEGRISYMEPESGMWSKEVDVLVLKLKRWHIDNCLELCAKALYRMRDGDGDRLGLQLDRLQGGLYDKMLDGVRHEHELVVAEHVATQVFKPLKGLIYQLNTTTSTNHLRWFVDLFKRDWTALDKGGRQPEQAAGDAFAGRQGAHAHAVRPR